MGHVTVRHHETGTRPCAVQCVKAITEASGCGLKATCTAHEHKAHNAACVHAKRITS